MLSLVAMGVSPSSISVTTSPGLDLWKQLKFRWNDPARGDSLNQITVKREQEPVECKSEES